VPEIEDKLGLKPWANAFDARRPCSGVGVILDKDGQRCRASFEPAARSIYGCNSGSSDPLPRFAGLAERPAARLPSPEHAVRGRGARRTRCR